MQDSTKELITGLCSLLPFMRDVKLQADLTRVCDNSKVTDHHAILPTAEFLKTGFSSLTDSETKLMTLVCAKLLCAAAAPYEYEAVTAVISCGGYTFTAKGKTTLCEGWREIEKLSRAASEEQDEDAEPETVLPPLARGRPLTIRQRRSPSVTRSPRKHIPKIRFCPLWRTRARKKRRRTQSAKG